MAPETVLAPSGTIVEALLKECSIPSNAHAGLVFDRYLRLWEGPREAPKVAMPFDALTQFVKDFNKVGSKDTQDHLDEVHHRLDRACQAMSEGFISKRRRWQKVVYRTASPLVTGLGTDHPTENGFTFDSTVGVPVLAGTGLKGLCRRASSYEGVDEDRRVELFGPERVEAEEDASIGDLVFLDAYPLNWPQLKVDIVNCHYPSYYRSGNALSLTETDDPIPVYFLAVKEGVDFAFRVGSRAGKEESLETGMSLLAFGLTVIGFGAKTAVGYGVMEPR